MRDALRTPPPPLPPPPCRQTGRQVERYSRSFPKHPNLPLLSSPLLPYLSFLSSPVTYPFLPSFNPYPYVYFSSFPSLPVCIFNPSFPPIPTLRLTPSFLPSISIHMSPRFPSLPSLSVSFYSSLPSATFPCLSFPSLSLFPHLFLSFPATQPFLQSSTPLLHFLHSSFYLVFSIPLSPGQPFPDCPSRLPPPTCAYSCYPYSLSLSSYPSFPCNPYPYFLTFFSFSLLFLNSPISPPSYLFFPFPIPSFQLCPAY